MKTSADSMKKWIIVATVAVLLVVGVSGRFDFAAFVTVTHAIEEGRKTCRGVPFIYKVCHEPMSEPSAENGDSS
ncbi:MAG: hypothetical protein OXI83_01850 [Gemmatimonadota bacterium]|nr:hypothetical protein [Gemmatimonadota bacterium]